MKLIRTILIPVNWKNKKSEAGSRLTFLLNMIYCRWSIFKTLKGRSMVIAITTPFFYLILKNKEKRRNEKKNLWFYLDKL